MGNQSNSKVQQADSLKPAPLSMAPGCFISPIAENEDAVVYCTGIPASSSAVDATLKSTKKEVKKKKKKAKGSVQNGRFVESSLIQNRGRYLILPKNPNANGEVIQVKSCNPYSKKIYFVTKKQFSDPLQPQSLQEINTSNKQRQDDLMIEINE